MKDIEYMKIAIALAEKAGEMGEVPVGAVVVKDGVVIGEGYNLRENNRSAISHAEVIAIEQACKAVGDWRLSGCTLYVTLEPCPMCAGAIVNSRIKRVVFGAKDGLAGCCGSVIDFNRYPFSHAFEIEGGICDAECLRIIRDFFDKRRKESKTDL